MEADIHFATVLSNSPETHILRNGNMRFDLDFRENWWSNSPISQARVNFNIKFHNFWQHRGIWLTVFYTIKLTPHVAILKDESLMGIW